MSPRSLVLAGLGAFLVSLISPPTVRADEPSAARLLPGTTVFYAELPQLSDVIDVVFDHPLRAKIEKLPQVQAAKQKKEYIAFQGALDYIESQLGMGWREALAGLTSQGVALAFDAATEGVALIVRAKDEATLEHIRDVTMELVRADAKNKGKPDPYESAEYRGVTVYKLKQGGFASVGDRLVVVNKGELGQAILDRLLDDKAADSLAAQSRFREAAAARDGKAAAWAWVDVDWVRREAEKKGKPFQTQTDNPVAELLVGGLLDTFQHTPWLTGSMELSPTEAALRLRTPNQPEWTTEAREFFFGPGGSGEAPNAPQIDHSLLTLSTYRNLSEMWLRAGDLFPENVVDKLAEADSNLTVFFSGRDFGEDILGSFEPTLQIVAARQTFDESRPTPSIKLPAFALLFSMKDAETTTRDLKRIFSSFVGFINITGAMQGNPQLELSMPAAEGFELVSSQFLPRVGEEQSREAPIQFNFSPTVAFSGKHFILASSEGLARELAAVTTWAHADNHPNTSASLDGPTLREVLADNESHLVAKNMLEEGRTRAEAEHAIGLLLQGLRLLKGVSIDLTNADGQAGLDVELRLNKVE